MESWELCSIHCVSEQTSHEAMSLYRSICCQWEPPYYVCDHRMLTENTFKAYHDRVSEISKSVSGALLTLQFIIEQTEAAPRVVIKVAYLNGTANIEIVGIEDPLRHVIRINENPI